MAERPRVSVVVVNWNRKEYLARCFEAVLTQRYPNIETILVDNGSHDGSVELVKERFPNVRLIALDTNRGFAQANNIGISASSGVFVMTLNNDTQMAPDCISTLVEALEGHPEIYACAPKIISFDEPPLIVNAGIGAKDHMPTDRGGGEPDDGRYDRVEEVFGPNAGAGLYRRMVFETLGGFDEDFFAYYEDVDLAWRARLAGWKCLYIPSAVCRHVSGGTSKSLPFFTEYHLFRNIVWLYIKGIPGPFLRPRLLPFLKQEFVFWKTHLRREEIRWLRMKWDTYRKIPRMFVKRRQVQRSRRIDDAEFERWFLPMLPR
ncbi:MAG: glycosyltransferase family 2 protein [candidate division Zixibacteria bacterium]|nr:glycosyltransferase family 2 protein [candidate division Zixibacteria bacterium]